MATREFPIVGDSLALGYRFQRHWDDSMAAAFFFGELGAGIFLAGALYGSNLTMIVGVLVTAILKTYFHLAHMGVPSRAWRAISRPDRSWISRGFISIIVFTGAAVLHIALNGFGLADSLGAATAIGGFVKALALIAALVVMTYHGFAIADSTSISFWNTGLMPVTSLLYSALGGVTVARVLAPSPTSSGAGLLPAGQSAASILLVVAAVALLAMLNAANRGSPGARKSLHLLTREGPWVKLFYGVVLGVGLVLPFALLTLTPASMVVDAAVALAVLAGYFTFRILVFKIGLYDPIISFARQA